LIFSSDDCGTVAPVLAEIEEATTVLARSGIDLSLVLIASGPSDNMGHIATDVAKRLQLDFSVLLLPATTVGQSLLQAFARVLAEDDFDIVVTLDAEGHHDGRQIPDLVRAALARNSGITIGSRWVRGGSAPGTGPARSLLSRGGNALVRGVTGVRGVRDSTTSFRVYRRDVVELLVTEPPEADGYGFFAAIIGIAQAHGFTIDEVPIIFRPRYSGVAKLGRQDLAEFARALVTTRRQVDVIRDAMRSNQALWAQRSARLQAQGTGADSTFGATEELSHLSGAERFLSWIRDEIAPYLRRRVLEVGAGVGGITRMLAEVDGCEEIVALEPAGNLFADLVANTSDLPTVHALQLTSGELLAAGKEAFDSVVYVSVLEHILDDVAELRTARALLAPGGHLAVFVPAMPSLYGSLDFKSGHFRRYDRDLLRDVVEGAGFEVVDLHYLDVAGVIPYWLMYRVLNRSALDSASSKLYDSVIVPASRMMQRAVPHPPLGKNLVAVARQRRSLGG